MKWENRVAVNRHSNILKKEVFDRIFALKCKHDIVAIIM